VGKIGLQTFKNDGLREEYRPLLIDLFERLLNTLEKGHLEVGGFLYLLGGI
jgi:hypothetical protein